MSPAQRPPYLERVSEFICSTALTDLGAPVIERGRWIIADCIPVIAAGMQTTEMKTLAAAHLANAAPGQAWVLGTGRRAGAMDAALLNGTAGTCLELDEGNLFVGGGHPGIQVVPAALAAAQELGSSGEDLLLATILGYEICARIVRASKLRPSVHSHGTYGVIGAAIAVAKLKGFNQPEMRELLNVAATMGMATSRNSLLEGATVRNIYTGHSGYMGQLAVRLVESGFSGEVDAVQSVFGSVLSESFEPGSVIEGLGSEWLVTKNYFKLHPTGRYVHSAIDALEDAVASQPDGRIDCETIERIDVKAYKLAAGLAGKNITSSFGARFSIPFALASILHHGCSGLKSFDDEAVGNPRVQQLVAKVFVVEELSFNDNYPNEQRCDLVIRLKSGIVVKGNCLFTKGELSNPHSEVDLRTKFLQLGSAAWGEGLALQLLEDLMGLDAIEDVAAWSTSLSL
jgi:2-methylcitrate dehydratase PrpD